jgi:hypothetical protein
MGGKSILRRLALALGLIFALGGGAGRAQQTDALATLTYAEQGWSAADRESFYTTSQGSHLIPYAWFKALKRIDVDEPFAADKLQRYGFLAQDVSKANPEGLPVGFVVDGPVASGQLGLTCAACHTGQLEYAQGGVVHALRIDGAPAKTDAQQFLTDLLAASRATLAEPARFAAFAKAVLGPGYTVARAAQVKDGLGKWVAQFGEFMDISLPAASPWGPGRLDAFGMIFNRIAARDLGIRDNYKVADAPVRYPFLWNAAIQDKTQWPGFADNGSDILGLARNLGEVLGVFARFEPIRDGLVINFLNNHSANFDGLGKLEDLIKQIGPPKWQWPFDLTLAAQGKDIYDRPDKGNCKSCHTITPGKVRLPFNQTWATPIQNVNTDTREYDVLAWTAKTGVLQGAFIPLVTDPLKETDLVFNILATSVIGSIAEHTIESGSLTANARVAAAPQIAPAANASAASLGVRTLPPSLKDLPGAFNPPASIAVSAGVQLQRRMAAAAAAAPPKGAYESRVLQGIWATAPYLHNGSVATLADLLKPAADRAKQFKVGSAYDTVNVGLAVEQPQPNSTTTVTTDCSDLNSGNSRCGHEFGTQLTDPEKKALLEYLKTL